MALPFYNEADQAIYEGGQHFIPQEQYRLNYTAPEIMGQNTNAGITATGAANPYKWPWPQGGGEGAGNISGTQQRSWNPNQNLGSTNITDYEAEADDVGSTWGGSLARLKDLYSRLPTPGNLLMKGIRRWKENREIKKEQERIAEDRTGIGDHDRGTFEGDVHPDAPTKTPEQGGWHPGVGGQPDQGGGFTGAGAGSGSTGPPGRNYNIGGRIGYADGTPEIPEGFLEDFKRRKYEDILNEYHRWKEDYERRKDLAPTQEAAQGGRIGYERGRVVNPGGYNGVIDRNIANLEAALKYSDLTAEERAQVEADLQMSLEAKGGWEDKLLSGEPVSKDAGKFWEGQAQGGRIGYFDGGIARLL